MSLHVHICNTADDADLIIATAKLDAGNPNLNAIKMEVPDIMVFDHSEDVSNPNLLNQNKVCVVIQD